MSAGAASDLVGTYLKKILKVARSHFLHFRRVSSKIADGTMAEC